MAQLSRTESVYYVTCADHGTVEGAYPSYGYRDADGRHHNAWYAYCPEHPRAERGEKLTPRIIDRPSSHAGRHGTCDSRCLNGNRHCECQCGGRCHGAGACQCDPAMIS